jgi:hypothetical protein
MRKCPKCGYNSPMSLSDDKDECGNLYGRICRNCLNFIEPDSELGLVKKNKLLMQELRKTIIEKIIIKKIRSGKGDKK